MVGKRDWFAETYPWMPAADANGHKLGEGKISLSFVACRGCPAATDGRGHHVAYCSVIPCDAPPALPDDCAGVRAQH
jgi:hypothetical protein